MVGSRKSTMNGTMKDKTSPRKKGKQNIPFRVVLSLLYSHLRVIFDSIILFVLDICNKKHWMRYELADQTRHLRSLSFCHFLWSFCRRIWTFYKICLRSDARTAIAVPIDKTILANGVFSVSKIFCAITRPANIAPWTHYSMFWPIDRILRNYSDSIAMWACANDFHSICCAMPMLDISYIYIEAGQYPCHLV